MLWISILNTRITTTTQKGFYIVFLFKKDMSGFYLSLAQGVTFFENKYKSDKFKKLRQVALYFQDQITNTSFSSEIINLGAMHKNEIGYGYSQSSIIAKYYQKDNFTDEMIVADLHELSGIYDEIVDHMGTDSYETIIEKILDSEDSNIIPIQEAFPEIMETIDPNKDMPRNITREIQVVKRPEISKRYKKMTAPSNKKIDYVKKAQNDQNMVSWENYLSWNTRKNVWSSLDKLKLLII